MSFEQIKSESATLTPEQRRQVFGHLIALACKDDADARRETAYDESPEAVCHRVNKLKALEAGISDRAGL